MTDGFNTFFRCKNCQHASTPDGWPDSGWLSCTKIERGYGKDPAELPANQALVEDDEGWGISVGPDFGCVLWEAKND